MKNLSLKLEKAKEEYVNAINEITVKYELDMYFVDIIIGAIYVEINRLKQEELIALERENENGKDNI